MNWIETPLSKFGFKCIMSKHDICDDQMCECLCHERYFDVSPNKEPLVITENVKWFSS